MLSPCPFPFHALQVALGGLSSVRLGGMAHASPSGVQVKGEPLFTVLSLNNDCWGN